MFTRETLDQGSFRVLGAESIPTLTTSTALFPGLPAGCSAVLISIYSGVMNVRFQGSTATLSTGLQFGPTAAPIALTLKREELANARAIQSSGVVTGWITYLGGA